MTTPFSMTRDINGYNGFGLKPTDTAFSCTLTINTDTTLTIPDEFSLGQSSSTSKARLLAIIVSDPATSIWVALNTTAAVPAGATFVATLSALNPSAVEVKSGDVLHFISPNASASVSVRLYWINS